MTGEDLGYKPSVLEQVKFDYFPLGRVFTKGLDEDDQKEGLFKILENIKGKNEELLKAIEDKNESKDDRTKSLVLLKDGLEELTKSYLMLFSAFCKKWTKTTCN